MGFRGTFEYNIDDKKRVTLPALFREIFQKGLVLAKGIDRCVTVWEVEAYEAYVSQAFVGLNPLSAESRQLSRYFAANSLDSEMDSSGRIKIPSFLLDHADLHKAIVVTGAITCLEIWDKDAWTAYNEDISARAPEIVAAALKLSLKEEDGDAGS
jgi:MraZ protein